MTHELHRQFENSSPCDMIKELKSMFEKQARVERFDLIQTFHACKQEEGKPVAKYILKMKGNLEQLERLGYVLPQDFRVGLILNGLTSDFAGFVYLKWTETPQVMMIKSGKIPKPKNPKPSAKEHPAKDDTCHHYKEVGHWKRNCHVYRAELLKKKKKVGTASSSGIFTIELFAFPNKSWVYDAGCGTHICITKQGFREARNLKQGALYLYVGNGVRVQVEAIGSYDLVLPNGFVICLDNCHYAPSITRGVVLVHRLVENGSVQCFTDFGISVSKKNVLYFNVIPSNGIYEIDMHDLVPDDNFIYNVSTKRAKHNLDSTYLWHYRLAHISNKRIEKLQQEGLLKSTDEESFDQCVSCLSGKIHVSRKDASYFITFTDDYIHYGYVYLLKHKHEVFETFKVFKNEVKKQLGKTINALRSDRGRIHKPRVDWKSSKQSNTAMSAIEAEYIATLEAAMEAVWIRKFISGPGIVPTINEHIRIFCDNSAALYFANEPGVQRGVKHYHRRYHYVRESIALGEIRFLKVYTYHNLADPFTKALSNGKFTQRARSMRLCLVSCRSVFSIWIKGYLNNLFYDNDTWKRIRLKRDKSEQNRIKTGQKREAWQSWEKSKAVSVDRARKTEENAKRMVKNAKHG
nr:hypothetical protein [Tanacetum cinerariifolium]